MGIKIGDQFSSRQPCEKQHPLASEAADNLLQRATDALSILLDDNYQPKEISPYTKLPPIVKIEMSNMDSILKSIAKDVFKGKVDFFENWLLDSRIFQKISLF